MLKKCEVCGLILDSEMIGAECPKCHAGASKFRTLSEEEAAKITRSTRTNNLLTEIAALTERQKQLAEEGIADQLDPGCVNAFEKARSEALLLRQIIRAEIAIHVGKEKW